MTLKEARKMFLGKRVIIKDVPGIPPVKGRKHSVVVGELVNLCPNKMFPSWGIVAILGRNPFTNILLENIELYPSDNQTIKLFEIEFGIQSMLKNI